MTAVEACHAEGHANPGGGPRTASRVHLISKTTVMCREPAVRKPFARRGRTHSRMKGLRT